MFQYSGTKAQVTIAGVLGVGLPQAAATQTFFFYSETSFAINGSKQLLKTPTAGKKLYITSISINTPAAISQLWDGNTTTELYRFQETGVWRHYTFPTPIEVSVDLRLSGTNGNTCSFGIMGFEA